MATVGCGAVALGKRGDRRQRGSFVDAHAGSLAQRSRVVTDAGHRKSAALPPVRGGDNRSRHPPARGRQGGGPAGAARVTLRARSKLPARLDHVFPAGVGGDAADRVCAPYALHWPKHFEASNLPLRPIAAKRRRDACFCSRAKGGVLRRAHWRPPWTSSSHLDRTVQRYCFRMLGAASQPSAMGAAGFEPATSRV
jgi:hypothetical protein